MVDIRSRGRRRTVLKAIAGAGAIGLAGCLGDDDADDDDDGMAVDDDDDGDDTDPSADLEDELTIYTTTSYEPVFNAFEEEYGVTINESVYTGPEVTARFTAEAEAGELQADATIQSLTALTWPSVVQHLAEVDIENVDAVMTDDRQDALEAQDAYGRGWPIVTLPYGAPYNPQAVDTPPETHEDFLDSQFEDRIAMPPQNLRTTYLVRRRLGWDDDEIEDFILDLDANVAAYTAAAPPTIQSIIAGEYDLGYNFATHFVRTGVDEGAPIDVMYPEFTTEWYNGIAVTEDESNDAPNLARELAEWITSDRGQQVIAEELQFWPADHTYDHGHPHMQQRIEEYDPELIPVIYSEDEVNEIDQVLTDLVERVSLA